MDCFNDLIGVRGMLDNSSTSVLYLDDVGITKDLLDDIIYTPGSAKDLVNQKLDFATTNIATKIKAMKSNKLKTRTLLESERVGYLKRTRGSVAAKTGFDGGVMIETRSDRDYIKINIDGVSLFSQTTGDVTVTIYDLQTGKTLKVVTVSAVAGEVSYQDVDLEVKADKRQLSIGVLYESTFAVYDTTVLDGVCSTCGGYSKQVGRFVYAQGIKVATGSEKLIANKVSTADTSGISVSYTVQCDYDQWICRSKAFFQLATLYATGLELMEYGLRSPRNNPSTNQHRETMEQIRDFCEERFNANLESSISNLVVPSNDYCFECRQKSRHRTTL